MPCMLAKSTQPRMSSVMSLLNQETFTLTKDNSQDVDLALPPLLSPYAYERCYASWAFAVHQPEMVVSTLILQHATCTTAQVVTLNTCHDFRTHDHHEERGQQQELGGHAIALTQQHLLRRIWQQLYSRKNPPRRLFLDAARCASLGLPGAGLVHPLRPIKTAHKGRCFRFWIDYQCLSNPASAALLEQALLQAGGHRTGGAPKLHPTTGAVQKERDYGYMHLDEWDLLWTVTAKAMLAAEVLRPGQMLGVIPGFLSITRKTSLVSSLRSLLGDEGAFCVVPRTFKLPDELDAWASWLASHPPPADTGAWILKNNRQRGTGLRLVRTADALEASFEAERGRRDSPGTVLYRWYLAQQYVSRPLLVDGRKFGVRAWVLVPGTAPLRAYIHRCGLVLFAEARYDPGAIAGCRSSSSSSIHDSGRAKRSIAQGGADAAAPPGHLTNASQNVEGDVWPLSRLMARLGHPAATTLWHGIMRGSAAAIAAAGPRIKQLQAQLLLQPGSCFQFLGLDFVVDENLKPWLLEVNATPSMTVQHPDAATAKLIHDTKWPVVQDMVRLLGICPERFGAATAGQKKSSNHVARALKEVAAELQRRGGFVPLVHLFPQPPGLSSRTAAATLPAYTGGDSTSTHRTLQCAALPEGGIAHSASTSGSGADTRPGGPDPGTGGATGPEVAAGVLGDNAGRDDVTWDAQARLSSRIANTAHVRASLACGKAVEAAGANQLPGVGPGEVAGRLQHSAGTAAEDPCEAALHLWVTSSEYRDAVAADKQ